MSPLKKSCHICLGLVMIGAVIHLDGLFILPLTLLVGIGFLISPFYEPAKKTPKGDMSGQPQVQNQHQA